MTKKLLYSVLFLLTVFATRANAMNWKLYICDLQVTSFNAADLASALNDGGYAYVSGKIYFDENTRTLTFEDATVNNTSGTYTINNQVAGLTIEVKGSNSLAGGNVSTEGALNIIGTADDQLNISCSGVAMSLQTSGTLHIEGANVSLSGLIGLSGFASNNTLSVSDAKLEINATNQAINKVKEITLEGCYYEEPSGAYLKDGYVYDSNDVVAQKVVINRGILVDETHFPDADFCDLVSARFGAVLTPDEIATTTELYINSSSIKDLTGIGYFTALKKLDCRYTGITSLDVSALSALEKLDCSESTLTSLDVSGLKNLNSLYCYQTQLTSLNAAGCTALSRIIAFLNQLTSIDLTDCTALEYADVSANQLASMDLNTVPNLLTLIATDNQLAAIDLSHLPALEILLLDQNQFSALDLTGCKNLLSLDCNNNPLTALDLTPCPKLQWLDAQSCYLNTINLSKNIHLNELNLSENQLTTLDLSKCVALYGLECNENQLTSINLSSAVNLNYLECANNQLTSLDLSSCINLSSVFCSENPLTAINLTDCEELRAIDCEDAQLESIDLSDCKQLSYLNVSNNQLTALDFSNNPEIYYVSCSRNRIDNENMKTLVNSLPTGSDNSLYIYDNRQGDEENLMSTTQAEAAKAKGWIPYYYDETAETWEEYAGEDITGINVATSQAAAAGKCYSIDGRKQNAAAAQKGLYIINGKKVLVK